MKSKLVVFSLSVALTQFASAQSVHAFEWSPEQSQAIDAGQEGHGGDVFDVSMDGTDIQTWDMIEYADAFAPIDLPEFSEIKMELNSLKVKSPTAYEVIMRSFDSVLWAFVNPQLKPIGATGSTQLILSYNKIQAAVSNVEKRVIQINRPIWAKLDTKARVYLLVHEAMWFASLSDFSYKPVLISSSHFSSIQGMTTANIRRLTGMFLAGYLSRSDMFPIDALCEFFKSNTGESSGETSIEQLKINQQYSCNTDEYQAVYKAYFGTFNDNNCNFPVSTPLVLACQIDQVKPKLAEISRAIQAAAKAESDAQAAQAKAKQAAQKKLEAELRSHLKISSEVQRADGTVVIKGIHYVAPDGSTHGIGYFNEGNESEPETTPYNLNIVCKELGYSEIESSQQKRIVSNPVSNECRSANFKQSTAHFQGELGIDSVKDCEKAFADGLFNSYPSEVAVFSTYYDRVDYTTSDILLLGKNAPFYFVTTRDGHVDAYRSGAVKSPQPFIVTQLICKK